MRGNSRVSGDGSELSNIGVDCAIVITYNLFAPCMRALAEERRVCGRSWDPNFRTYVLTVRLS